VLYKVLDDEDEEEETQVMLLSGASKH